MLNLTWCWCLQKTAAILNAPNAQEWQANMSERQLNQTAVMMDGCNIVYNHYLHSEKDRKPTILFSNSLGTTVQMWDGQLDAFCAHFNVVTYDKRGHGKSEVFPGAYSLDRLGNDVIELLDLLGLEKVHFCALSIGGMTAQWLVTYYPELCERIIVANSAAAIKPATMWQHRIAHVTKHGLASIWDTVLARWLSEQFAANTQKTVAQLRLMFESIDVIGYAACCAAIRNMDMRNIAHLNPLKTLIIAGTQDLATPVADAKYLYGQYRNAKIVELNAGHLSNVEQPNQFYDHVLAFSL